MSKHAILVGASGLVGARCLARLLDDTGYDLVTVYSRRPLALSNAKLRVDVVDFDRLRPLRERCDDIFCCLGTTIKKAGSQAQFKRVDHDYPLALAMLGKAAGARQFLLVSSLGASAQSRVFYSRIKGETERDIAAVGLPRVIFMRPSILLGARQEHRPGERAGIFVAQLLAPLLVGPLRKYRPIHADDVAAAMLYAANHELHAGAIESEAIVRLAQAQHGEK